MQKLHSVINQDGFGHIADENNQYYQPKIKTSRKPFIHNKLGVKIGEEVTTTYKICTDDCISKNKLISFLEDKIKESEENWSTPEMGDYYFGYSQALEKVLDFVNKGGK